MGDSARKATPNTRASSVSHRSTRITPSKLPQEIETALSKMRTTPSTAATWLRRYQLIPEDAQTGMGPLSTGLAHFAAHTSAKLGAWALEAICAFAVYAESVQTDDIASALWEKLHPELNEDRSESLIAFQAMRDDLRTQQGELFEQQERIQMELSGAAGRVTKETRGLTEGHAQLRKELAEVRTLQNNLSTTVERLAAATEKLEEATRNPPAPAHTSADTPLAELCPEKRDY